MNDNVHELAAAYALDALDEGERGIFEAHLPGCDSCLAELSELAESAAALADAVAAPPPAHLRRAVLDQLGGVDQVPSPRGVAGPAPVGASEPTGRVVDLGERRRSSATRVLAAAAVAALVTIGAVITLSNRGTSEFDEVARASDAVVAVLEGDAGTVEVFYSPELDRVAVRGSELGRLGPGLRYALWAIADDAPTPAGLFGSGDGSIEFVGDLVDVDAEAWGVTIEPASGSDEPTGTIILFAEV